MTLALIFAVAPAFAKDKPTRVIVNADNVLEINGKRVFHVGFDLPPLPDARAWNGKNGIAELRNAGATFIQSGPVEKKPGATKTCSLASRSGSTPPILFTK